MPYQIYLFIFGLLVGSFLNVLSIRYKPGGRIFLSDRIVGRSHCPHCKKTLSALELVPLLSYIFLLGKCRSCKNKISLQYPIVETITGLLTAYIPFFLFNFFSFQLSFSQNPSLIPLGYIFIGLWLIVTYALILMTLIDLKHSIIPDQLNLFLTVLALAIFSLKAYLSSLFPFNGSFLKSYSLIFGFSENILLSTLLALAVASALFTLIIFFTKGKGMGLGDLKLVIPLAILIGWPDILLLLSASFIIGSLIALPLLVFKLKGLKDGIPFGPFLAIALFATLIYGEPFMRWYFQLI